MKKLVSFEPTGAKGQDKPPLQPGRAETTHSKLSQQTGGSEAPRQSSLRMPTSKQSTRRARTSSRQVRVDPVTLLQHKQPHYQGNFNTMAVFETLPTMYTKERFEEL